MPPRLAHKKSRRGCQRCKTRKVKCSEERPACKACLRHKVTCDYPDERSSPPPQQPSSRSDFSSKIPDPRDVLGPVSPYALGEDVDALDSEHYQRRLLELQLLHHFVIEVAGTFPASKEGDDEFKKLYSGDVVRVAFQFPFLLHTVFAIAALHKTVQRVAPIPRAKNTLIPSAADEIMATSKEYVRAHRIYLNMAIRQQREAILQLGPANAEAICLNSILLSVIALRLLPENNDVGYEPPTRWLSMSHAIKTVVQAAGLHLPAHTTLKRLMARSDPDFSKPAEIFDFEHMDDFQAVLKHPEHIDSDEETENIYLKVVGYVSGITLAIQRQDPQRQIARRLLSSGPMLPPQFVSLVEARRPKALVVLAHLMSTAKYVENYWFFKGSAEREVYGIRGLLPDEWQWAMKWPLQMLETLSPPTVP